MALQHLRSSTADKRPTPAAMSDGQLALNTNLVSPGLFFKDSNGDSVKIGPVHVGTTAPNVTPGAGGQAGNSKGEQWLDTSSSRYVFKIWDGTAWRTEDGEFVNASGDTMTGALIMDNQQQVRFRETTGNGTNFIAIQAPASVTADRTLTLPDVTGTIVSTADTGTVTSTMILDGTIVNADINASAAIVDTKLDTIATAGKVSNSATTATNANTASAIVARDASGNFSAGTITAAVTGAASSNVLKAGDTMTGALVVPLASAATPSLTFTGDLNTGIYSPGADKVAVATNGAQQVSIDSAGKVSLTGDIEFSRTNPAAITVNDNGVIILSADSANTAVASSINMNVDGLEVADFTNAGYLRFNKTNFVNAGICNQSLDNVLSLAGGTSSFNSGLNLALSGPDRVSATGYQMRWNTTNLYQWDKTSDFHAWYTGAASERLRITSAGLVGIGISVPTAQLHVANVGTNDSFIVEDSGSDATPFRIAAGGEVFTGSKLVVNAQETYNDGVGAVGIAQINGTGLNNSRIFSHIHWGGSPKFRHCATPSVTAGTHTISVLGGGLGAHEFFGSDGVSFIPSAAIASIVDATPSVGVVPGNLTFSTAPAGTLTERLRITSAGLVGIGTNAPAGSLNVSSNTAGNPSLTYDTSNIANFDYGTIQLALGINAAAPFGAFLQARDNTNAARVISLNPSGGNVGIGVTNPGSALEINAAAATSPFIAKINTSEAARIDSSGRLLVGTSSVRNIGVGFQASTGSQLFIEQTSAGLTPATFVLNRNDSNGPRVVLGRSRGTALGSNTIVQSGDELGRFDFAGADGTDLETLAAQITAHVDGTPGANDMPGRLVFSTTADGASTPTEAMRIDSSKKIWVSDSFSFAGSFVSASRLKSFTNTASNTGAVAIECAANSTDSRQHIVFTNTNGAVGSISTSASATAYNTSSDYRLKENVVDLDGAIARLNQLPVHRFNFKADPDTVVDGFIAHEAQEVVPECVTGTKDEEDENGDPVYQGIDQSKIVPLLTAALQEAIAKIEVLESKVAALEGS
jgi:hypothetical protein